MSGEERSEELKGLEAALAALTPRVERFDRERLIFEAGRASALAERGRAPGAAGFKGAWPTAFTAMTAVAATLLVMLVSRPGPQVARRPVEPSAPVEVPDRPQAAGLNRGSAAPSVATDSAVYDRRLRQLALMHGIDLSAEPAVPRWNGIQTASAPASVLQLEHEMMRESSSIWGDRT